MGRQPGTMSLGTLSDTEIIALCTAGKLIVANYRQENVKQACYELCASNIYYDIAATNKKNELLQGQYILIKPKQLIVIITLETIELPANLLGRILTKGKLFSVGLLPVNTYADPGFYGKLGIVFYNLSNNFLKIYPGEAIAKIEFSRMRTAVAAPYRGQHGYQTSIWPIPEDMILTDEEVKKDTRIKSTEEEIILAYGQDVGNVVKRVFKFERYLLFAGIAYFTFALLLIILIRNTDWLSPILAIALGIGSNLITSLLLFAATNLRRR